MVENIMAYNNIGFSRYRVYPKKQKATGHNNTRITNAEKQEQNKSIKGEKKR
jgi:hypothetical protein